MQASFCRRALPKLIIAFIALTLGVFLANNGGDKVSATTTGTEYEATFAATLSSTVAGANANVDFAFNIPANDLNFSAVISWTPPAATIAAAPTDWTVPFTDGAGDVAGVLTATATLGLTNFPCATPLILPFIMLNSTTDNVGSLIYPSLQSEADSFGVLSPLRRDSYNVSPGFGSAGPGSAVPAALYSGTAEAGTATTLTDNVPANPWTAGAYVGDSVVITGGTGTGQTRAITANTTDTLTTTTWDTNPNATSVFQIHDTNGLPSHVDRYPAYNNVLFPGATVLARYSGSLVVVGQAVIVEFLQFGPGGLAGFAPPHPLADLGDIALGYPSVTVLNDPTQPSSPSSITDFCSPLSTVTAFTGITRTNPCAGNTAAPCNSEGGVNSPAIGGATGRVRYANPAAAGTYMFWNYSQSLRDQDNDGIENGFDTCPYAANIDGDPRVTSGPDADMIDSVCDDGDLVNEGLGNYDGDTGGATGGAWQNAQDNCPMIGNGTQTESENPPTSDLVVRPRGGPQGDSIGDACEQDVTPFNDLLYSNGHFHTVALLSPKCIGGTDADGDGWCATGGPSGLPNDAGTGGFPSDTNAARTPEDYAVYMPLPLTHAGSSLGSGALAGVPGLAFNAASQFANAASRTGEPYQVCNDGLDNDGDTLFDLLDTGCRPVGVATTPDWDGDGFSNEAETTIGTDPLGRCGAGSEAATTVQSVDWPLDTASGQIPNSTDRINIYDLTAFLAPVRIFGTSPGVAGYQQRFDVSPGTGGLPGMINIYDLTAFLAGTTGFPPMPPFNSTTRAFGYTLASCTDGVYGEHVP